MNIRKLIAIWMLTALGTTSVSAAPVTFDIAGDPFSSVDITSFNPFGFPFCVGCGLNVSLNPDLDSQIATLNAGESWTFPFFNIDFFGFGGGTASVEASLAFDSPFGAPASNGQGGGGFFTFFGLITAGNLTWSTQPGVTTLANNTSYDVAFQNLNGVGLGPVTVHATIHLLTEPAYVPEPSSLALLGVGLIGLISVRRRKNQA